MRRVMDPLIWHRMGLLNNNNNQDLTVLLKECSNKCNVQVLLSLHHHLLIKVDLQFHPAALEELHEQPLGVLLLHQFVQPLHLLNILLAIEATFPTTSDLLMK